MQRDLRRPIGQGLQRRPPVVRAQGRAAAQQAARGALVRAALRAVAHPQRGKAQPQRVARACERDVEQAQVFAQALVLGLGHGVVAQLQVQRALTVRAGQLHEAGGTARDLAEAAGKWQADHGVFQALALVHGDHLHQVGVAFQAHDLLVAAAPALLHLGLQPADERVLAVELRAGGLQQLGQVQEVGQAPLAAGLGQPARGQAELVQRLAQQGQHALRLPDAVELAQLQAARIEGLVAGGQPGEFIERQPQGARGQTGAHLARIERIGHGLQPVQQVARLVAGEHRVLVGQVDRGHAAPVQLAPDGLGLLAGAHQHGDVGRAQALEGLFRLCKTGLRIVQPADDLLGAARGKTLAVRARAVQFQVVVDGERGHGAGGGLELLGPAARLHRDERQRVVLRRCVAEQEGARARACLGTPEPVVHGRHQRRGGAVVGAQHVMPPGGGAACGEVAVDVGAAEAVDRLLGVANEQQRRLRGVVGRAVEPVEDAVLQRRGVLEFVDQRHRGLRHHAFAQALAVRPGQRLVQPLQHVGKAEGASLALELGDALLHARRRVQAQRHGGVGQRLLRGLQRGQRFKVRGQRDWRRAVLARLVQAVRTQAVPRRVAQRKRVIARALCPFRQGG